MAAASACPARRVRLLTPAPNQEPRRSFRFLNALKSEPRRTQLDLANAVGIEGPTLTRHLDGIEQAGLVRRQRGTLDRRAVQVELTRAGHTLHGRLLKAVISFNQQLRAGLSDEDVETLRSLLRQLRDNAEGASRKLVR